MGRMSDSVWNEVDIIRYYEEGTLVYDKDPIREPVYGIAAKNGLLLEDHTQLLKWLAQAPKHSHEHPAMPSFRSFDEYLAILRETKSYEVHFAYHSNTPSHSHRFAGIGGLTQTNMRVKIPFFTVYGHSSLDGELSNTRTCKVFLNRPDIRDILEDIGLIRGNGHIVVTKGGDRSANAVNWTGYYGMDSLVFEMHTHPCIHQRNYRPSPADFNSLESNISRGFYGRENLAAAPLYISRQGSRQRSVLGLQMKSAE